MRRLPRAVRVTIVSIVLATAAAAAATQAQTPASAVSASSAATAGQATSAPTSGANAAGQAAPMPKPMSLIDLASLPRIAGAPPQLSPDGKTLAYMLSRTDWKVGRQIFQVWRQEIGGGAPIQLTFSDGGVQPAGPGSLRWSPDGRTLLFLRDGQIALLPLDGGETRALTKHATAPNSASWSADGKAVYFIAADPPSADDRERTRVRDDVFLMDEGAKARQLWMIAVSSGVETQVTSGELSVKEYSLSADGRRIVVQRAPSPSDGDSYRGEVWVMDANGEHARVLTDNSLEEKTLDISPDGTQVLFTADMNERFEINYPTNLFVMSADGGTPRLAAPEVTYTFDQAVWAPDGRSILASVNMGVHSEFFRIDVAARRAHQLTDGAHFIPPGWAAVPSAGKIVYQVDEPARFGDVWTLPMTGDRPTPARVTRQFDTLERDFAIPRQEKAEWKGADGAAIEGVLFYPAGYRAGERYPLVVQLHGGPMESDKFGIGAGSMLYYLPVLTGKGYFVLRPNYRGSAGYGAAFVRDVIDGYFHQMAPDVMRGVDALIARGLVDQNRLVLTGWSAGGTLVDKLLTMTDRFKVASSGAGISNWISLYGQTDNTSFRRTWFGGTPWRKDAPFDLFWNNSPIKDVANVKTPTLFFAGEADARVPKEQSVEMYRALKSLDVATQLVIAPNEGHVWGALQHLLHKDNIELEWFERYVNGRGYVWEKAPAS
ncbi:MAG TPA: S9 family peptidase [Vicinamibacterales bacterium]|nr:S9 family peptidase [Vicinamibacterales bacterium]